MQWMSEATAATFDAEVLERSRTMPVIVDFWAAWCAPCKLLGPILEQAVAARGGAVWLVKVDADQNPELAQRFDVRGIPAVKAFVDGKLGGEFVGVQDSRTIELFIERLLPRPEEQALRRAEALLATAAPERIAVVLEPALQSAQYRDEALLLVARAHLRAGDYRRAAETLAEVPQESVVAAQAAALRVRLDLLTAAQGVEIGAQQRYLAEHAEDLEAHWCLAGALLQQGQYREALEILIALLRHSRSYREDGARRAMLAIFDELGPSHELTREFRRQLQIYT